MYCAKLHKVLENLRLRGLSYREIQALTGIRKSTVHRWCTNKVSGFRRHQKQRPFSDVLQSLVSEQSFWSVKKLQRHIAKNGFSTSVSTTWRELRRLGFKKCKTYPCGNSKPILLETKRRDFSLRIQEVDMRDVVCVDESSFYQQPNPKCGWTKGSRLRVPMIRTTGKRHSLVVGVSHLGLAHYTIFPGSFNAISFARFITDLRSHTTCKYILLDNVAFHKTKKVRQVMDYLGFEPLYTSPYSPEWNPAEMLFSLIKRRHNHQHPSASKRGIDGIEETVNDLLIDISPKDCQAWMKHCWADINAIRHR